MANKEKTGTMKLKVSSFRKIPNPYVKSTNEFERKPEMYVLICDVMDIPDDIPMQTNPREQKLTTNVAKKIRESLTNHSERNFYLLNRGLLLSCSKVSYDNVSSEVSLSFDDLGVHGDIDGGHTYKIIKESKKELEPGEQYCKIEVLTGVEDMFEQLAAARNTSVQVPDASIAELEKRFEVLKDTFKNEAFANDINYKQNDIKRIDIQDILSLLFLFNIDRYPTTSLTDFPISAYSGKKVCTDAYINASKQYEGNESNNPYEKMKSIMVDVIKLYDMIELNMGDYYRGDTVGAKYGRIKGVATHQEGKPPFRTKFYQKKMKYISPNGFLIPILGAFRALVVEKDGKYEWIKDPFKVLEDVGPTMVNATVEVSRQLGNNPNATGKSSTLWMNLFMCVKMQAMMQ